MCKHVQNFTTSEPTCKTEYVKSACASCLLCPLGVIAIVIQREEGGAQLRQAVFCKLDAQILRSVTSL